MITTSPVPVVDVHHHLADLANIAGATGAVGRGDARFEFMDEHGVDAVVVSPQSSGVTAANAAAINDAVADYRDRNPERVAAVLATCDPLHPDAAVEEITRAISERGARGIVLHHHFQGTVIDDPRMAPVLQAAADLDVPVFVHVLATSLLESPFRLERLALSRPDVAFVALDGFSSPAQAPEMLAIAQRCPNIAFDTGVLTSVAHGLAAFLDEVGAERLLYGSDFYSSPRLFQVPFPLYELLNLGRTDDELRLVLGGNARRILQIA